MDKALEAHIIEHAGKDKLKSWLFHLLGQIEIADPVQGEVTESGKETTIKVIID